MTNWEDFSAMNQTARDAVGRLYVDPPAARSARASESQLGEIAAMRRELALEAQRARQAEVARQEREDQLEELRRQREDLAEASRRLREEAAEKRATVRHRWSMVGIFAGVTAAVTGLISLF